METSLYLKYTISVPVNSGCHLDNLRGHPDHVLIFFIIFTLTLYLLHLSSQEAFLDGPLTPDPSGS